MFKPSFVALCLLGCATTNSQTLSPQEAARITPVPVDPKLPNADRIADQILNEAGTSVSADVEICSRPSGKVSSVGLVTGSVLTPYDLAVVEDASNWTFTETPGPDTVNRCDVHSVAYYPYQSLGTTGRTLGAPAPER